MDLEHFDAEAHHARRARLAAALGTTPALFAAGASTPRNYRANTFAYRAGSHFLYFVGLPLRGAYLFYDGAAFTLYVVPPGPDDALWHGAEADVDELARLTGLSAKDVGALGDVLRGRGDVATLGHPDAASRGAQGELPGRALKEGAATDLDRRLAEAVITLRLVHDGAAIDGLRRAAAATAAAHASGMATTEPGILEAEVRAAMEREIIARKMSVAYGSIVTVHGEILHNDRYHHRLAAGDLLLADVGAETHDGWAGDVTRTWPVSGAFSSTQRDIYEIVLRAQLAAIEAVAPGRRYRDVHLRASTVIAEGLVSLGLLQGDVAELVADGVHALFFPHGIGHLLGLDVHDMEDLGDLAGYAPGRARATQHGLSYLRLDRDLAEGMAVTIEPGIYFVPAILENERLTRVAKDRLVRSRLGAFGDVRGIRIEDDVLVTAQGHEVLTRAIPKSAEAIEGAVLGARRVRGAR